MTLNRNVTDYHAEIEQAAFEPNNIVPGIGLSPDKMLLARGFSYADAHRARLGVNYKQIPVNAPQGRGAQLHQGRRDADPQRHRPGVRAELHRAARRPTASAAGRGALGGRRRHGPRRLHAAPGGRRLGPGRHAGPRGARRRRAGPAGRTTSSATCSTGVQRAGAVAGVRVLANVDADLGKKVEEGVRANSNGNGK